MTTLDRIREILSFISKDSKEDNTLLRKTLEDLEQKIINRIDVKL